MPDALFSRDGDVYHPTRLTEGPWSPDAQHGGPPAALLAGAIEKAPSEVEMMVARVTIELLRPIPLQPLRLATSVIRPGKKVQLVSAMLTHEDTEIARATGLRIRVADLGLSFPQPATAIPSPSDGHPANFFANPGAFATDAMEIRMVSG
ncbi:MAG TPA: acyl-CoA thioesterase domain-containing protein, partial [Acidimicrobiia bacterium]